ncbi:MAG: GNAT family N-acetyltransferase [Gemmataceae bacterium]
MTALPDLHYYHAPRSGSEPDPSCHFMGIQEFLADEPACKGLWSLIDSQFRTRSKFLAIWRCVSFVIVHRNANGTADGFLLVSAPVNWQIDYVVVHPEARGQGVARKLIQHTLAQAASRSVPYVMLTSNSSLREMYESFGFRVVSDSSPVALS